MGLAGQSFHAASASGNDVLFYRHFHGPLFHYLLIPVSRLGWSERGIRTAMLAIPCASLAVVYFGSSIVDGRASVPMQLFGDVVYRTGASSIVRAMLARESDSSFEGCR